MRLPQRLALFAIVALLPAIIHAHQEDPKSRNRQLAFSGAGYRAGPPGGGGPSGPLPSFPSQGVTLMSWLTLSELGQGITSGNDCWGYVSSTGREYALIGTSAGTTVVEVSQPGNSQVIGFIAGPTSLWRDIKTYQSYAYSVSEGGGGIQVIDLSDVDNGNVSLVNTVVTGGTSATHNVAIDEDSGFLYRCGGGSNGLRIYDLANPAVPTFVGSWPSAYVHDVQVVTYTTGVYAGMQVAFVCGGLNGGYIDTGLYILDVTNKASISSLGTLIYPNGEYSHQAWLSPDRQYIYLDDELDEGNLNIPTKTFVINVSNLSTPTLVSDFTNGNSAIGHNLYTVGDEIYQANYRSGLRIFDATDPENPFERYYFDTYPDDDANQFNGLWSVYPYFPSGTVIGSDLERGLFVWRIGNPDIVYDFPNGVPSLIDPDLGTFEVNVIPLTGIQVEAGTPTLWFDGGSGWTSTPLVPVAGDLYEAVFPPLTCGETVEWYLNAETTGGSLVSEPINAPGSAYSSEVLASTVTLLEDEMESDGGWTAGVPGDNATTGLWTRVDPIGTLAQPEDDHSATGTDCWVTGQGTLGGALGENDVDGGTTTLESALFDTTGRLFPTFRYWRWFSNSAGGNPGEDFMRVDISDDDGANWATAEFVGPTGSDVLGGWIQHEFRVTDHVNATTQVRLRFVVSDLLGGSIVEAAIDDLQLVDGICADCNLNGLDDSVDIAAGTSADLNLDGIPDECTGPGCPTPFIRGDVNGDSMIDLSDVVATLIYLFGAGAAPVPLEAADIDAGGVIDLSDAVQLLSYLFSGGQPPAPPFPTPGCP